MDNCCRTINLDSKKGDQITDQIQRLDQNYDSSMIQIEAQIKNSDCSNLCYQSSIFIRNNIVTFAGCDSEFNMNNELRIYNLNTNQWSQKELKGEQDQIPKPRYGHTANVIGNFIYIIGGVVSITFELSDKMVYKINFDTQECQTIGEILDFVGFHTANAYNQNIYIFGGIGTVSLEVNSTFSQFNLTTNLCKEIKIIGYQPQGRYAHNSIIVKDKLYIFGGQVGSYQAYLNDMFQVDLSNNLFTEIEQKGEIPSPRSLFSLFTFQDQLYLFGGSQGRNLITKNDFYRFDLQNQKWSPQKMLNQKCLLERGRHQTLAVMKNKYKLMVYLIGGQSKEGFACYKNMNIISFFNRKKLFWQLHFLQSTGIQTLIGLNMIQEIIELSE